MPSADTVQRRNVLFAGEAQVEPWHPLWSVPFILWLDLPMTRAPDT
jgi:hypothetical protein